MSHIKPENFDQSQLKIAKSGRAVSLRYSGNPFQLSSCKMYTPFGINGKSNDYSPFTNWTLDCSINQNQSEASVAYQTTIDTIDASMIDLIKSNNNLFNPKDTQNIDFDTDDFYSPILRPNKTYPKLMKLSFPRDRNGNILAVLFDEDGKKVLLNDNNIEELLGKGTVFKCITEFSKFWCFQNRIGSTWNVLQLRICPRKMSTEEPEIEQETVQKANFNTNLLLDDD